MLTLSCLVTLLIGLLSQPLLAEESTGEPPVPVTTEDPTIPNDELALLLAPLTKKELLIESDGWLQVIKTKAQKIALAQIAVKRQNQEIEKAKEAQTQAGDAQSELKRVEEKVEKAKTTGDSAEIEEASTAAEEARKKMQDVSETVQEATAAAEKTAEIQENNPAAGGESLTEAGAAADKAQAAIAEVQDVVDQAEGKSADEVRAVAADAQQATVEAQAATAGAQGKVGEVLERAENSADQAQALEQAGETMAGVEEAKKEEKVDLLEEVTRLREDRTLLLDNMRTVIEELEAKTDPEDKATLAAIKDYRLYMQGVSGLSIDVSDTTSAWISIKGWVTSEEGGIRWITNLAKFIAVLLLTWVLARAAKGLTRKVTDRVESPVLLKDFLVRMIYLIVWVVGIIWALSTLEISMAPLLAIVGAAGFIVAFATQDSLSNFANGLMILFFRPFDVGDEIETAGVSGKIESMNLVSTSIRSSDDKLMVVPNSKVWGDVITNSSAGSEDQPEHTG
ncbi:MAG: mechanosensitive ion channel [Pseudomonadota bacterium]|nr:mechanosensitive ion channel [Pseudomonadota bacterium]